ncbi:mitochondrial biogenesis AIM24-domain-containing protein [Plectosphaerella cucumerina]|uniref:Altered inheritance of mitochondria protein 24, mitochondrial n=1 Tax=Plectosphaerella cucumerina TaxID=40658 RepID=A0A8K0TJ83_9PEZI|nr:mitochondrial biogenesis AIM24-domain-containing protein [Plectosphaerella cucumerina]
MRGHQVLSRTARSLRTAASPSNVCRQCRTIQISAAPTTESPRVGGDAFGAPESLRDAADARFEVLGAPYSLLSVTLSPSQQLYTRRGTLVAVAGQPENAQSTLSILSPLTRGFLGVPFLYQKISSSTPVTALISTKSPTTTFSVLHLDGTTDYMVTQRNALLAWTGHTLTPSPRINRSLSLAHWGNTLLTGRGLAAVSSPGQIYQLTLGEGEEFVAHPSHVVAYAVSKNPPLPFRFKSSALRLQIPSITGLLPEIKFFKSMRDTATFKTLARFFFGARTSLRRTIWGDRLFLQFRGPTTLLLSSRGVRVADALTNREVNEIADTEAGVVSKAIDLQSRPKEVERAPTPEPAPTAIHIASVSKDGKVTFEDSKNLKERV